MHNAWNRTLATLKASIKEMSGEQRLWARAWCLLIEDAIDGPDNGPAGSDIEGRHESRKTARDRVLSGHDDLIVRCDMIGLNADAITDYFSNGVIKRVHIEDIYRNIKPD